jgi:tRNA G18 (ribose-2'-O)-methylase SpoU
MSFLKIPSAQITRVDAQTFAANTRADVHVVLDNIRSHHNVGAFFRTCDAFPVQQLWLTGITPVPPHRDIQKTALGAQDVVQWAHVQQTRDACLHLKSLGYTLIAVEHAQGAVEIQHLHPLPEKIALVFGNEVEGVQQQVLDMCDLCVEIPQWGTKHSLNVSVCGGVVLWDVFRRKMGTP